MIGVTIHILATLNPHRMTVITPHDNTESNKLDVFVGLINQNHYVALEKKSKTPSSQESSLTEEKEDQVAFEEASEKKGLPYDTCMQPETFLDENDIYSIAPGEKQSPLAFLSDPHFEVLSNPDKYPLGNNSFSTERSKRLTVRKFFNQRLLNVDGRFARDIDYLLTAQYIVEAKQVQDESGIALRQTRGMKFQGKMITAGILKNSANMKAMIRTDAAVKFLKNVRGSPAYWQRTLYDVLAMVRQIGIPTWFLTLFAADLHWPEIIQSIARQYGKEYTEQQVLEMSWEEKSMWLRTNPVTAARQFQYHLDTFFHDFLCSEANPVGEVADYFTRIKFQARGSPHSHSIIWIRNARNIGTHNDKTICEFIDKYITCDRSENACTFQKHKHSSTCRRNGGCRFQFPRPPSIETIIARPVDASHASSDIQKIFQHKQQILLRVKEMMAESEDNISTHDLLQKVGVSNIEYTKALKTSKSGMHVILKREPSSQWINSYNTSVLKTWHANIDIQYIVDPYACIMYVTSYMMKSERAMSDLLCKVAKECDSTGVREQLRKLRSTFLNHREVSAQEAVYRILSMPLKQSTRHVIFVNTSPKVNRVKMLKPMSAIREMDESSDDLFCCGLLKKYAARPDCLEDICLATFAAKYRFQQF